MARTRWLDRVRHRPAPSDPHSGQAELLAAFLADPASTDLRPITKAMSRDVCGWILGHPAVRTAQDAWVLRAALIAYPDLQRVMEARLEAQRLMLAEALSEGDAVPPLFVVARLDMVRSGHVDGFLQLLPPSSVLQVDVMAATQHAELCRESIARVRSFGVRAALTGLHADGTEDATVREVSPDVLMLDVAAPLDYRDRRRTVVRLREEVGPHRAQIVMGSVASAVDEWAGNDCGADFLTGPFYDNEDFSALSQPGRDVTMEHHLSPYEQATASHPAVVGALDEVLGRLRDLVAQVCACGDRADAYLTCHQNALVPELVAHIVAMVGSGAAVTALGPNIEDLSIPGLTCASVATTDSLARGWSFVALLPGEGHLVAGMALDDTQPSNNGGQPPQRPQSYVVAQDRNLALHIANRISQRAAEARR